MNPPPRELTEGILRTDLYQLTMAQLYWRTGQQDLPVVFEHFFRSCPDYGSHRAGYCVNAGLHWFADWMQAARFSPADLDCLRALRGSSGRPLFEEDFLRWLARNGHFDGLSLRAIPEGRVIHPLVPVMEVSGPLAMAQILETALLNQVNHQILIATKAARIRAACGERTVIDFGLRRAHGGGANAATRAALIGGASFTSNVGLSHALGYPPKGTHAHSMVQVFLAQGGSELDAFRAYAECYPDDCLLLVDTVDTMKSGVPNAIRVFEELRRRGRRPLGIRLDSGDLACLGVQAARLLDEAGFAEVSIVLSGDLDELAVAQIQSRIRAEAPAAGADAERIIRRLVYGIGTRLIASQGCSALGGVYKLSAVWKNGAWEPAIKISDTPEKELIPGRKRAWRLYSRDGAAMADLLGADDESDVLPETVSLRHPVTGAGLTTDAPASAEPLLEDVIREGRRLRDDPGVEAARDWRARDTARLAESFRRIADPAAYPVALTAKLWNLKADLTRRLK